jgi:c-di-GMP-binding flagellar brake protein YcgR
MSGPEKRRDRRVDVNQSIWVEGQDVRVEAEAVNISKGGMFVVAEGAAPEIGSTLEIKFDDPLEGKIAVKMEVVWRDEKTQSSNLGLRAVHSDGIAAFERVVTRYLGSEDPTEPLRQASKDGEKSGDKPKGGDK